MTVDFAPHLGCSRPPRDGSLSTGPQFPRHSAKGAGLMRHLLVLTALSIALLSTSALAVDALTTAADQTAMRAPDKALAQERAMHEAQLALIEKKMADLRKNK